MATQANIEHSTEHPQNQDSNYTMLQAFEWYSPGGGVHWKALKGRIEELSSMGITAMWLPPPTKAASQDSVGYDTYDLWDLGEFEQKGRKSTKYGTKAELIELIRHAHDNGVISYVDAVLNHKFGADRVELFRATRVDSDNRKEEVTGSYDINGWTGFDFPGRNGEYSQFKWSFNHFTGIDHDENSGKKAIFRIDGDGKDWARGVDNENGNYDYLMGADIDHSHPEARDDLLAWGKWVVDEIGAAGFRFDAIKHIDRAFIADFVKHVRGQSQKTSMFAVGEFWKNSLEDIDAYLRDFGTQFSIFDAPLHYNFKDAGESRANFDLRTIFDGTLVQCRPMDAVTLVDNHDTQIDQALESWVSPWFKPLAYTLILLREDGYPCVFYGDLYGCGGEKPQPPVNQLADIIRARKLFGFGETRDAWDHPNCLGWVRAGNAHHDGCAVVMCNGDEGFKRLNVGEEHAGEKWTDILGWHGGEVIIGKDGWGEFRCSAQSVSIWTKTDARGREEFKRS